jgi:hypothetical protein
VCAAGSVFPTGGVVTQPQFAPTFGLVALDYGLQPGLGPGDALVGSVLLSTVKT